MRTTVARLLTLLTAFVSSIALVASAQDLGGIEQGIKPYGSYHGGDIDSVSMVNGSLQVRIPLVSLPQRGGRLKVDYTLVYQNPYYTYTDSCQNDPNPTCIPSWYIYHLSYGRAYSGQAYPAPTAPFGIVSNYAPVFMKNHVNAAGTVTGLEVHEMDGTVHLLGNSISQDATGYTATANSGTEILIDKYGTRYYFPIPCMLACNLPLTTPFYLSKIEDVNGNMITPNSNGVMIDTFGRQLGTNSTSTTDYSGCTGTLTTLSATIMSYPAPNGGTTQFKFCYASSPVGPIPSGCSGTCHPINTSVTLLQSVVLWNGASWASSSAWTFALDGYGALSKVTLPTGGSISYTTTVGSPGGECFTYTDEWRTNYGSITTSRTVDANDGTGPHTWAYNNGYTTAYAPFQTVVTDPNLNDTVHKMTSYSCSVYETEGDQYSGPYTAGAQLKKTVTTYIGTGGSIDPSVSAHVPTSITTTDILSGKSSQVAMTYDPGLSGSIYGNVLTKTEYDFDNSPLRKTINTYMIFSGPNASSYQANNLNALLYTTQVQNGGGTQLSLTQYNYDETAPNSSGLTSANQWDSAPPSGTFRGNNTSVFRWLNSGTFTCPNGHSGGSGGYLKSYKTYFNDGMLNTAADPCGNTTTYAYSLTYWGSFPTTITDALNQSRTNVYDFNTGLLTSTTDANNLTTSYNYDPLLRISQVNHPDGGQDTITHQESTPPFSATLTSKINSTQNKIETSVFDGLGRTTQTQLASDQQGAVLTDTTYDALGRVSTVSNPHRGGTDPTSSPGTTTYTYDALSRKIKETYPDASFLTTAYCGPSTLVTDPTGKWRRSRTNGLGQLVELDEPNSTTASVASSGCPGTGEPIWVTSYTNDALGNLTQVVQNGAHTRTFTFDSLSRLLTSANPETGTITYTYNPDNTILTKKDARNITTTYTYDALLREKGVSYSNGDPALAYNYDETNCLGLTACQNRGHRTSMTDGAGSEVWAYQVDQPNLRSVHKEQRTNNSSPSNITKSTTYYMDLAGGVTQLVYPSPGGRTVNYTYDSADRPSTATDSSNGVTYATDWQTPPSGCLANAACYTPQGSVYAMALGKAGSFAGINFSETFNNRLQPNEIKASASYGNAMDITYNFVDPVSGKNAGHVYKITNNLNSSRTQTFTYDQLNRITSAGTTATTGTYCWGYQFSYDAYGNLLSQAGWTPTYNACTEITMGGVTADGSNHISGLSYDASGNTLTDGNYTYTWNGESQIKTAAGVTYSYDGDGRRAAKVGSKLYWYGSGGEILSETDTAGNVQNEYIFFSGKRVALMLSTGDKRYYVEDSLGTSRVVAGTGTVCYDADFAPFGQERAYINTCSQNYKFEGKERDTETQNDDFGAREYSWRFGRWLSSDWSAVPVPVPYARLNNPQTLNLYAMVSDDPESFADLDGHESMLDTSLILGAEYSIGGGPPYAENPKKNPPPPPPIFIIRVDVYDHSFTFRWPLNSLSYSFFAGAVGHHGLPRALFRYLKTTNPNGYRWLNREFVTGRLTGSHYYDAAHRAYNEAVRDLLKLNTEEGQEEVARDVVRAGQKILDSDNPAIKGFLDNLPKTADGTTGRQALERAVYEGDGEAFGEFVTSAIGEIVEGAAELE